MKYAALIFGDDERQPKAASVKLSSPEPGQVVRSIDGSAYRVASKLASPDGVVVKLSSLQGGPAQTPLHFRPIATSTARLASWLRYHLAYNRDFDLYINAYVEKYNQQHPKDPLPYPVGRDGKPFRWADWFQKVVSPKLYVPGRGSSEDQQTIKDELIHEMLFTVLGHRDVLSQFVSKAKSLGVGRQNAASKLTDFLISTFMYRIDEMQNKLAERMPEEEISMWQPGRADRGGEHENEVNMLESEEFGVGEEEFESAEAKRDIAKFREGFRRWLAKPSVAGEKSAENFILMFDLFWRNLEAGSEIKRSDIQDEWLEKTGLSYGSFKEYFANLPDMIEQFITSHSAELGDKNIFVDLMEVIRAERDQRERREDRSKRQQERRKERAQPAQPAMASLNVASAEGEKVAEYTQEDWERDEAAQYSLDQIEEAKHWEGEEDEDEKSAALFDDPAPKGVERVKRITSHVGLSRYMDLLEDTGLTIPKIKSIPSPYAYSPTHTVYRVAGTDVDVIIVETAHKQYDVFEIPPSIMRIPKEAASKIAQKLVRGDQLTPEMVKQVKDAFIYRWTSDNKRRGEVYHCDKCDVRNNPYVNTTSAEGHQHPTIPLQTDEQWLAEHAFYFTNSGKLQPRRHAQPAYLAPEEQAPILASVAHKFAMEKAAYNPGKAEYIYQADTYCERCGKKLIRKMWGTVNDQGDSDTFPQGPYYNQEADYPQFCAGCGVFLENPLTQDGYDYLNQMILEHEADGKGQSDIIDELKAFYPEREYDDTVDRELDDTLEAVERDTDRDFLRSMNTSSLKKADYACCGGKGKHKDDCSVKGTDSASKHTAMLPHEFNNADGQAINDETNPDTGRYNHESDTTELKERRMGASAKTAIDPSSLLSVAPERKPTPLHKRPTDPVAPTHPLQTRESETGDWQCMDCGAVGKLDNKGGGCETCGSQAVFPVSPTGTESPELVRETSPIETEKRMIPRRTKPINAGAKTAQGSGGTTVTFQNQNVTTPNTPGRPEPMAVPEAINQSAGPHSPNAPATAPRTPGITPKIVNVPPGTEGESMGNTASANDPEEVTCPKCGGTNVDIDAPDPETYKIWCEDCDAFTYTGGLVSGSPARDYRETPGDEMSALERMGEIEGELGPEPDFDAMYEEERLDQFDKGAAEHDPYATYDRLKKKYDDDHMIDYSSGKAQVVRKDRFLEEHGWVKENEHHGATWWMGKQMWYKKDYEESIPAQDTDEAVEKELELLESKTGSKTAYFEHNLGQSNSYWRVKQPFEVLEVTGHKPSNTWIGRSQALDPVHEKVTLPAGAIIENLHGGLFFKMDEKDKRHPFVLAKDPKSLLEKRYMPDKHEFPMEKLEKIGAGSNSGSDDDRGAGDLWRENFYEHRTKGLTTDGLLSGMKEGASADLDSLFMDLDETWSQPDQAPEDDEIEVLGQYLAETQQATSVPSGVMLAEKWRLNRWPMSSKEDRALLKDMGIQAAAAPAVAPGASIHPNVQQQLNLMQQTEAQQTMGGPVVAITPQGQSEEAPKREKHTVEPELPNARYHMISRLAAEEETRMLEADPEYAEWLEALKQSEGMQCEECLQAKPDVAWQEFEDLGAGDPNSPMKHLQGFFCEDCALDIAQDI